MKYLVINFFRDIKKLFPQFISVLIMAAISTTIFTGMSAVWESMATSAKTYYEQCNLADIWVYAGGINDDDVAVVKALSYVKNAAASAAFTVNFGDSDIQLFTLNSDTEPVLNPLLRSGNAVNPDGDGIWLNEDYAALNNIKAGDKITVSVADFETELKVSGIVLDAENIYYVRSSIDSVPDNLRHGYGYIGEAFAQERFGAVPKTQLRLELNAETDKEKLTDDMKEIFGERYYTLATREDKTTIQRIVDEQKQIQKMALLFSSVFIVLSLLTMYTTMSRLVDNQILQIGTLKALGFSNEQIYFHYAMYGFIISLIGGLCGHFLGLNLVSPIVLNVKQSTLTLPEWNITITSEAIAMWLVIIFICTISSLLTGRRIIKAVPALTIQGIVPQKRSHNRELKRSKLSYGWLWTIRSIKLHKARFLMGIIAVTGSVVLMTAGLGVNDSIVSSYGDVYENLYTYDYAATISAADFAAVKTLSDGENVQFSAVSEADFTLGETTDSGVITVLSDGEFVNLYENEEPVSLPESGVCMTRKFAESLGVKAGDKVQIREKNSNKAKEITVLHIVSAKLPQGIFVSENDWKSFAPTTIYFDKSFLSAAENSSLISGIISIDEQKDNADEMIDSVKSVMTILIFAAFVLSAVVLYNLGTLNFIERYKEYATMKVLGFYRKELRGMVLKDTVITLVIGLALGIPASFAFLKLYIEVVSFKAMEWTVYIQPAKFIAVLVSISAFTIAISLLVAHKIRKVDMVEAMKSVE